LKTWNVTPTTCGVGFGVGVFVAVGEGDAVVVGSGPPPSGTVPPLEELSGKAELIKTTPPTTRATTITKRSVLVATEK
jgi:hypothetical protein